MLQAALSTRMQLQHSDAATTSRNASLRCRHVSANTSRVRGTSAHMCPSSTNAMWLSGTYKSTCTTYSEPQHVMSLVYNHAPQGHGNSSLRKHTTTGDCNAHTNQPRHCVRCALHPNHDQRYMLTITDISTYTALMSPRLLATLPRLSTCGRG